MKKLAWFERQFIFNLPAAMLPFYLERLEGTIVRIREKVKGLPDGILSEKHQGKWSVKQHIGHLAEVDEISLKRIDEMIIGVSSMTSAVFETKQDYNSQPVDQVLKYFRVRRLQNIERYKKLTSGQLNVSSLHPRLKVRMTPVDLAWFDAEHDDHHLVRMNEIIDHLTTSKT